MESSRSSHSGSKGGTKRSKTTTTPVRTQSIDHTPGWLWMCVVLLDLFCVCA
jgi:hypothetical protein